MSFTISTSDIKEAYEKRKQFESCTDAATEFLSGCIVHEDQILSQVKLSSHS